MAYALHTAREQHVQYEKGRLPNPSFDQVPPVVLAANLIPSSPPVVEGQSDAPDDAEDKHIVDLLRAQPIAPCPIRIMRMVNRRQDRPNAVHLRPIPIDLGEDKEDWEESNGEGKARNRGIGGGVYALQALYIANVLEDRIRELV